MTQCHTGSLLMPNASVVYDALETFDIWYGRGHDIMCIIICIVGVFMNVLIIIVLVRPDMRTAINTMLTFIAICDSLVMLSYLVFMLHFNIVADRRCDPSDFSYAWATFALIHLHLAMVGHTSSLWISVAMAQIRHTTLVWAEKGANRMITVNQAVFVSAAIVVLICLAETPVFLSYSVIEFPLKHTPSTVCHGSNTTLNISMISPTGAKSNCLLVQLSFWTNGLVFKLIPCLLLTIFITLLLRFLKTLQKRRMQLRTPSSLNSPENSPKDRTTRMLVLLLAIFLATEVPQGILAFLSGIFSEEFRKMIYNKLGDVLDLLSLINSASNFVILTTMSKQFRTTFLQMFMSKKLYHTITGNGHNKPTELTVVRNRVVQVDEAPEESKML